MSKIERQRSKFKMAAKKPGAWREIAVTPEIRASAPHMKNVHSIFANGRYEVQAFLCASPLGGVTQVCVARHGHIEAISWHELLAVKNELFGVAALAVEIYPREEVSENFKTRILWVLPEGFELPYGLNKPTAWGGE